MTSSRTADVPVASAPREDAGYWSSHFRFDGKRLAIWREVCRVIEADIPAGSKLLDLGAGRCYFANQVRAAEVHALDLDPGIRECAAAHVRPHVGPSTNMDMLESGSFDVVFASNFFEHLTREQFDQTLAEVARILRPGGRLIALQPNYRYCYREYFDDYTHVTVFTDHNFKHWVEARGFRVRKLIPRFIPADFRNSRPTWPWLVRLYLKLPVRPFGQQLYCVAVRP